jgi:type VI secretion system protein VasG
VTHRRGAAIRVEPRALVRRLTPTATRLLDTAAGRAVQGGFYEIVVEHVLSAMLDAEDGDVARILANAQRDRLELRTAVERTLGRMRTGNAGRPRFAEVLFEWFENAWLLASVEHGATQLRTGALLLELVTRPGRYLAETYPALEALGAEELRRGFGDLVAFSPEAVEAAPVSPRSAPASGGAGSEALGRFTTSFTDKARRGELDRIFGRDREIRQLVDILVRRRKNNPIIVGDPGVGKTALVEGLAQAIASGQVPEDLAQVDLLGLDLGLLQAGASVRGEFENRLKSVLDAVKASPKLIVLFIDEAHTLIGAGGAAGGSDAANLLKPALARGELRTIAATTWAEYKKYFEKDAALERRFQPVKVEEPSEEDAVLMLRGLRPAYEKTHGLPIRDDAVEAAVRLSHRYLAGRQLPDKAIDLLDTAAARVRVETHAKPEALEALESQRAALERQQAALVRDGADGLPIDDATLATLERELLVAQTEHTRLEARWRAERDAVLAVRAARTAKAALPAEAPRAEVERAQASLAAAGAALAGLRGDEPLVHLDVDADAVARVVSGWTGIPAGRMKTSAITAALGIEDQLRTRVRGQDAAIAKVGEAIRMASAGIRDPRTPVGVLLFVGTTGVGKTETALALADALYGGERSLITINMSEFQEKHSVSRLIGSPPGYIGYGQGGLLTEAVRQRPHSAVLLDECEKADLEVMNLFYQVFDKGSLTDGEGRPTDFRHSLLLLTSNLGAELIARMHERPEAPTVEEVVTTIYPVLSRHFQPALLARMTIVPFAPIGPAILRDIASMKLASLASRLRASHGIETEFAPPLVDELTRRCAQAETGARTVDHVLRGSLMPRVAQLVLEQLAAGAVPRRLFAGLAPDGNFHLELT